MPKPEYPGLPPLVSAARFCEQASLSSGELDEMLLAKQIFAMKLHRKVYLPAFFLDTRYDRRQLESVCKVLGALAAGSKLQFFTTPKGSLGGRTALEALAGGDVALVRRAAQGFAER